MGQDMDSQERLEVHLSLVSELARGRGLFAVPLGPLPHMANEGRGVLRRRNTVLVRQGGMGATTLCHAASQITHHNK